MMVIMKETYSENVLTCSVQPQRHISPKPPEHEKD